MKTIPLTLVSAFFASASLVCGATSSTPSSKPAKDVRTGASGSPVERLVSELEKMKGKTPEKANILRISSMWKTLPETHKEALKNDIVCLSCAGFLAIGDMETFGKARTAISDMSAFREETTERCSGCGGSGIVKSRCPSCGGSGRCSRCQGRGGMSAARLQGMGSAASMTCPSCHGSGRCVDCNNGTKETRHSACNGSGSQMSKEKCLKAFESHRSRAETYLKENIRRKKEEAFAAEQRAKGFVLRDGKWLSPKELEELERKLQEEKRKAEEEKRLAEEKKRKEEEFEASQRAKGFVKRNGKWMTPEEVKAEERKERFAALLIGKSRFNCPYQVFQVFDDGQALCKDLETGQTFCLYFSQQANKSVADGNRYVNNLYWCGTYSYTTVQNAQKRVNLYAIDLEEAIFEARRQGFDKE